MRNIERTEPDPALFQVLADCAITEIVAASRTHLNPNAQLSALQWGSQIESSYS